jgi:exopolysaccharide biosynthesis protein
MRSRILFVLLLAAHVFADAPAAPPQADLGSAERIADGVLLYRLNDPTLLDSPAPVAVQALRVNPALARIEIALAEDRSPARETVPSIARRRGAIAAVNGGFFALADGAPQSILKVAGKLIGRTARARGAVAFTAGGRPPLLFDRVSVTGAPDAAVFQPRLGSRAADWAAAPFAVSGAGLLIYEGRELTDWKDEQITAGFDTTRHPRTMIGVDRRGEIWLVTVDGRQPWLSLGMTFSELKRLANRIGLYSALNLDGGGSTTMVVQGWVVNHPADETGPRKVSDAIVVLPPR